MARSDVASWCRGMDCRLDGEKATISGWGNDFATISSLETGASYEWSWQAVNRIMQNGRNFYSEIPTHSRPLESRERLDR